MVSFSDFERFLLGIDTMATESCAHSGRLCQFYTAQFGEVLPFGNAFFLGSASYDGANG